MQPNLQILIFVNVFYFTNKFESFHFDDCAEGGKKQIML